MTDRFSPDYIDLVTKSEPIQALCQKRGVRVGDWCMDREGNVGIIYLHVDFKLGSLMKTFYLDGVRRTALEPEEAFWLPTLSDLLDMLEEAGCQCIIFPQKMNKWHRERFMALCPEVPALDRRIMGGPNGLLRDRAFGSDRQLAAARLLERVLAGKEESDDYA